MSLTEDSRPFKWGKKIEPKQKIKIYLQKEDDPTIELDSIELGKVWLFDSGYVKVPDSVPRNGATSILSVDFWCGDRMVWTCRVIRLFPQ